MLSAPVVASFDVFLFSLHLQNISRYSSALVHHLTLNQATTVVDGSIAVACLACLALSRFDLSVFSFSIGGHATRLMCVSTETNSSFNPFGALLISIS